MLEVSRIRLTVIAPLRDMSGYAYDASPEVTGLTRPSAIRTCSRRMFGKYGIVSPELEL